MIRPSSCKEFFSDVLCYEDNILEWIDTGILPNFKDRDGFHRSVAFSRSIPLVDLPYGRVNEILAYGFQNQSSDWSENWTEKPSARYAELCSIAMRELNSWIRKLTDSLDSEVGYEIRNLNDVLGPPDEHSQTEDSFPWGYLQQGTMEQLMKLNLSACSEEGLCLLVNSALICQAMMAYNNLHSRLTMPTSEFLKRHDDLYASDEVKAFTRKMIDKYPELYNS